MASYEVEDSLFMYIPEYRERWKVDANCAGIDTEEFFLQQGQTATQQPILKRICDACIVQKECLEYAVDFMMEGYWANTTGKQRSRMRAARDSNGSPTGETVQYSSVQNSKSVKPTRREEKNK